MSAKRAVPAPEVRTETSPDQGDWGPTASGGHKRHPIRWFLATLLVLAMVWVGLPAVAAATAMGRVDVPALSDAPSSGPIHTLVVGSDSRDDMTEEQQRELGTGDVDGLRTDTIFILSTNGGRAAMLGLPRDLFVARCDGSEGRINGAYAIGGPDCLVRTVEQFVGFQLHHYVEVGFVGFVDLVGAVGGVEVCLESPIKDPFAAIDLPAGCQVLTGRDALGYVRVRKIDNDLKRIERQQGFVSALADKATSPAVLLNPIRSTATARAGGAALTVDAGTGPIDLLRLARGGRGLGTAVKATVPVTGATIGGAAVLLPTDAAPALFRSFADGSIFAQAPAPAATEG